MTIKANVSVAFCNFPIADKISFGNNVNTCLQTEMKWLPNLPFSVDMLTDTNSTLNDLDQAAMNGDKVAIEKRKMANKLWNSQYKQTAAYISLICDGSVDKIKSTGFAPTKTTRQKKQKTNQIQNFQAKVSPAKGQATVTCQSVKGLSGYVMIAASEGVKMSMMGNDLILDVNDMQVRIMTSTVSGGTFVGLPSEQRVNIAMFAFNTAGSSQLTDVQTVLPQ